MPENFVETIFEVYPNSSGGQIQAQAKANQLQGIGYRVTFSVVSQQVLWQNHMPNGNGNVDSASMPEGVLLLTAVSP